MTILMRTSLSAALLLSLALPARAALDPEVSTKMVGQPAPAFTLKSVTGEDVTLSANAGHVVLVTFFASWCPPCRSELEQLKALHARVGSDVKIIAVSVDPVLSADTIGDVKPLADALGLPFPVALVTKEMADAYGFKGIPTTVVVGPDAKLGPIYYGYHDGATLERAARKLVAPPAKP